MAADKGEKRRRRRRYWSLIRQLGCFRPSGVDSSPAVEEDGAKRHSPEHLVVTVNGIIGSATDWRYAAKKFIKRYPEDVIVHCSKCNYKTLTFDGIDVMGERLAKEVMSVVAKRPELKKISFVAHSLGGLIARYAIGVLYGEGVLRNYPDKKEESDSQGSGTEHLEEKTKDIAGLEPMNFITFVTPHLGSRWHKQIPILCGSNALEKVAYRISWIVGRTGRHLFLKDKEEGKPPLLLQMVTDSGELQFMTALKSFNRRVAYSNASSDFIVGWRTSSMRYQHELPKRQSFMRNRKYPHVVYEEKPKGSSLQQKDSLKIMICQPRSDKEMEEAMVKGLNMVTWERVDVSFRKTVQRIFAHNTIQVNIYSINSAGADVILHMIDNFLL